MRQHGIGYRWRHKGNSGGRRVMRLHRPVHNRPSWLFILILVVISGCANSEVVNKTQLLLGTTVEISVADADIGREAKIAAINKAFERINQIDSLMSLYKKDSEVSKINNYADIRPVVVSVDTIKVIKRAAELNKITDGVLDITAAPLVGL